VEDGIPYIDFRVFGTSTGGSTGWQFNTEVTPSPVAAGTNAPWNASAYVRLLDGNFNGISAARVMARGTVATVPTQDLLFDYRACTNAPLIQQRWVAAGRFTTATVDGVYMALRMEIAVSQTVDVTIRVGAPQLVQRDHVQPFVPTGATSYTSPGERILSSGTNFSSWFNPLEGTVVVNGASVIGPNDVAVDQYPRLGSFKDGTPANRMDLIARAGATITGDVGFRIDRLSGLQGEPMISTADIPQNRVGIRVGSYKAGTAIVGQRGVTATTGLANVPVVNQFIFGDTVSFTPAAIRSLEYYPAQLTLAQIASISSS
jgi:hypothetical protein